MTKQEFIAALRVKLSGMPEQDVEERLSFYSEMIDDRIEEGMSEEDAISQIGSVDEIASQIISEIPLTKIVKEKIKPKKRLTAWEIILLVLGAPIWLPLLFAAISVFFAVYIVIWSVVISLWAVEIAFISCSFGGVISGVICAICGRIPAGIAMIGAGITFAGLSIFLFFGCKGVTKGILLLTKKIALGIKNLFVKKEIA